MPIYNKLVRDYIPQVVEAAGKKAITRVLAPEEHLIEIKAKMQEEAREFQQANDPQEAVEELADILELIHASLQVYGVTYEELEKVRVQKKEKRGGFSEGIYLIEVQDE